MLEKFEAYQVAKELGAMLFKLTHKTPNGTATPNDKPPTPNGT